MLSSYLLCLRNHLFSRRDTFFYCFHANEASSLPQNRYHFLAFRDKWPFLRNLHQHTAFLQQDSGGFDIFKSTFPVSSQALPSEAPSRTSPRDLASSCPLDFSCPFNIVDSNIRTFGTTNLFMFKIDIKCSLNWSSAFILRRNVEELPWFARPHYFKRIFHLARIWVSQERKICHRVSWYHIQTQYWHPYRPLPSRRDAIYHQPDPCWSYWRRQPDNDPIDHSSPTWWNALARQVLSKGVMKKLHLTGEGICLHSTLITWWWSRRREVNEVRCVNNHEFELERDC